MAFWSLIVKCEYFILFFFLSKWSFWSLSLLRKLLFHTALCTRHLQEHCGAPSPGRNLMFSGCLWQEHLTGTVLGSCEVLQCFGLVSAYSQEIATGQIWEPVCWLKGIFTGLKGHLVHIWQHWSMSFETRQWEGKNVLRVMTFICLNISFESPFLLKSQEG